METKFIHALILIKLETVNMSLVNSKKTFSLLFNHLNDPFRSAQAQLNVEGT